MSKFLKKRTNKKLSFHLFDVNPKSSIYLKKLLKDTNIKFNYLALSEEKGEKEFHFNNFFKLFFISGCKHQLIIILGKNICTSLAYT